MSKNMRMFISAIISFVVMVICYMLLGHAIQEALVTSAIATVIGQGAAYLIIHRHKD